MLENKENIKKDKIEDDSIDPSLSADNSAVSSEESVSQSNDVSESMNESSSLDANLDNTDDSKSQSANDENSNSISLPFIIGKKIGMSRLFMDNGTAVPVTLIEAGPCYVSQLKTNSNDGYDSVQLAYGNRKLKNLNNPIKGHLSKAGLESKSHLKEFLYNDIESIKLGTEVNLSQYDIGDSVNVTGFSKGKGFAGHMKRHNFSGGRASHGKNSVMRKAGSVGAGTDPGKVWKGTRMAGRMGNDRVTVKNLQIVKLDESKNIIFLKGAIPGSNNKIVYLNKNN
tara:strand:- start:484 stop:1332 length:849 start_codon:yes stop_codon:yes gene_type:complete